MDRYEKTVSYLLNRLPMFQRSGPAAYKDSLDNILRLDKIYGFPHRRYATLHIAGTNGKGSVSHMLASVLQAAGYRTGLCTSPHLTDFRERIRVNGKMIPRYEVVHWVADFLKREREEKIQPSFFELSIAMAFDYYARKNVDIAVIETGLGGRLDSTNIITPEVSVITNISYDHAGLLGNTLSLIAGEKAGIIKKGVPVVISQRQPEVMDVFCEKAEKENAPLWFADQEYQPEEGKTGGDGRQHFRILRNGVECHSDLKVDLGGTYQRLNIPAVLKTIDLLREKGWNIPQKALYRGLSEVSVRTGLRGRWQVIGRNPLVICDTGHNEDGIHLVTEQLKKTPYDKLHFVFGMVADKDINRILAQLPADALYYFTKAAIPRALDENVLSEQATAFGLKGEAYPSVLLAFDAARKAAGENDLVFVGGSNFIVGEILERFSLICLQKVK